MWSNSSVNAREFVNMKVDTVSFRTLLSSSRSAPLFLTETAHSLRSVLKKSAQSIAHLLFSKRTVWQNLDVIVECYFLNKSLFHE